jgi:GxxExxY protein
MPERLLEQPLTHSVIGAFFEVYNQLGYGFVERLYVRAMDEELRARGHVVRREAPTALYYKGRQLGYQRLDMIVDGRLVVEAKAMLGLHEAHVRQLFSYLRATPYEVGLLLNFGFRPRFKRVVWQNAIKGAAISPATLRVHP